MFIRPQSRKSIVISTTPTRLIRSQSTSESMAAPLAPSSESREAAGGTRAAMMTSRRCCCREGEPSRMPAALSSTSWTLRRTETRTQLAVRCSRKCKRAVALTIVTMAMSAAVVQTSYLMWTSRVRMVAAPRAGQAATRQLAKMTTMIMRIRTTIRSSDTIIENG